LASWSSDYAAKHVLRARLPRRIQPNILAQKYLHGRKGLEKMQLLVPRIGMGKWSSTGPVWFYCVGANALVR
jgi:hypothetical protein